ncbi:MAG: hypothetical protein IJC39_04800 [Firmicutes bacterium]|nr:hypothetical protein [Bacillota bacterium]
MLNSMEAKGLFASAGSACSSRRDTRSHVLMGMGLAPERADSALRFSFSPQNTLDEARKAAEIFIASARFLKKYGR